MLRGECATVFKPTSMISKTVFFGALSDYKSSFSDLMTALSSTKILSN